MTATVRHNERSQAINLITYINVIANTNDLIIKSAGGESTVSEGHDSHMFPDVILYGDIAQNIILQGWELKMPNVPIEDETFIKDAQRKANALGLNSCLIWNFTYAVLYERNTNGTFSKIKQWSDTSHIKTRKDVDIYRSDWMNLLEKILLEINQYFITGQFKPSNVIDVISTSTITSIIDRNKIAVAEELKRQAGKNAVIVAQINTWWKNIQEEYEHDETNPYSAYAKSVLLNWANRIVFAHLIKTRQSAAMAINNIDEKTTPREANIIFSTITKKSDFYHIFTNMPYDDLLPDEVWRDLVEFSIFLKDKGIDKLEQSVLQNILEASVNETKRNLNGQYTTPETLADILVKITVLNHFQPFMDCCCGTGTIARAAIKNNEQYMSPENAMRRVWASDKNQYPLQIANISMSEPDTINIANRIFQQNALTLRCGEKIRIIDPKTGHLMNLSLPQMGAVASNLPFVKFEAISDQEKQCIEKIKYADELDGRSDLYCYIALKIADILKAGGRLGIIISNSWLGTKAGRSFFKALKNLYTIKQVHISGCGRWFQNTKTVATIIILEKKIPSVQSNIDFFLWKVSLSELEQDEEIEMTLVSSSLMEKELDPDVIELSQYNYGQMDWITDHNISYNALFHKISWIFDVADKLIRISDVYTVIRGSRRGWDKLFFPKEGEHNIEPEFLKPVLMNAKSITSYTAVADGKAFCCGLTIDELQKGSYNGALQWIEKFQDNVNGTGKPLPSILKAKDLLWYEMSPKEVADICISLNPDKRLFFSKFSEPSFINQRLTGLKEKTQYPDSDLNHALLNSILTLFYVEAAGFGRGLGVLDMSSSRLAGCYMPNPQLFSKVQRDRIVEKFNKLKERNIKNICDELEQDDRIDFEMEVLNDLGIGDYFDSIKRSLISMQKTRATAKESV